MAHSVTISYKDLNFLTTVRAIIAQYFFQVNYPVEPQ